MDMFMRGMVAGILLWSAAAVMLWAWLDSRRDRPTERLDWGDDPRTARLASGATGPNMAANARR